MKKTSKKNKCVLTRKKICMTKRDKGEEMEN